MTDAAFISLDVDLKKHRQEVNRLREDLEDLRDYLDILEARRKTRRKPAMTQAQTERRYITR